MVRFANVVLTMAVACGSMKGVTTWNFDFTGTASGNYTTLSAFSSTLGVTATAFYTANATTTVASATISSSGGLGICNPSTESGTRCTSAQSQIDNDGRYEFMLFRFSTPVSLASINLINSAKIGSSADRDLTYYTSATAASSVALGSLSSLGHNFSAPTTVACASACSGTMTTDSLSGTGVTYLLVGAAGPGTADGSKDAFRIRSLSVTTNDITVVGAASATPEPGTWFLGLTALAAIGWVRRAGTQNSVR